MCQAVRIEAIRDDRSIYFPYASDHDIPWISTDDIGDVAAHYLLDDRWVGQWTRNLMEPENLTLPEIATIFSRVLNCSIKYVQVSIESIQQRLELIEATPGVQEEMGDLLRALGDPNGVYATV